MDWEVYPKGIYQILKELQKRYDLPILITENGVADDSDKLRQIVLPKHWSGFLMQKKKAWMSSDIYIGHCWIIWSGTKVSYIDLV